MRVSDQITFTLQLYHGPWLQGTESLKGFQDIIFFITRKFVTCFTKSLRWTTSWSTCIKTKIHFNIYSHQRPDPQSVSSLQVYQHKLNMRFVRSHALYIPRPSHAPWFDYHNLVMCQGWRSLDAQKSFLIIKPWENKDRETVYESIEWLYSRDWKRQFIGWTSWPEEEEDYLVKCLLTTPSSCYSLPPTLLFSWPSCSQTPSI